MSQGVFEKQQPTLDRVVILGELQEVKKVVDEFKLALAELTERIVRVEVDLGVIEAGYHVVYNALEINGLMSAGESIKPAVKPELKHESWNAEKIMWTVAQGSKGEYERSEDVNSMDFKALLKTLQGHKGKMMKDGYFMWVFANGTTVGRKRKA